MPAPVTQRPLQLFLVLVALLTLSSAATAQQPRESKPKPPNILWIFGDDIGPDLACYGVAGVRTPNLDRLASQGVRYANAHATAPVCSASRSALITGVYQTSIDAHHHRSHRGDGYTLPPPVRPITDLLREAGYFTANLKTLGGNLRASGKTDFNFAAGKVFDGDDWAQLKANQPFYAQINFSEPHRGGAWPQSRNNPNLQRVDPKAVELPPYYPDDELTRDDYANYLDAIQLLDLKVGRVLKKLEEDGLAENTVVIFLGDNGRCHVRDKQWLYDGGTHIPLIIRFPDGRAAGTVNDDMVSAIDVSATSLALAGIAVPKHVHGKDLFAADYAPRAHAVTARDRCDETVDRIRAVRTKDFSYIRNHRADLPYTQTNAYKERQYPVLAHMRALHAAGKLTPEQALFFAERKPAEELYDLRSDPHEVKNLADSAEHQAKLQEMRKVLDEWEKSTGDRGATLEPQ